MPQPCRDLRNRYVSDAKKGCQSLQSVFHCLQSYRACRNLGRGHSNPNSNGKTMRRYVSMRWKPLNSRDGMRGLDDLADGVPLQYDSRNGGVAIPAQPDAWQLKTSKELFESYGERNRTPDTVARMRRTHSSLTSGTYGPPSPLLQASRS